jgi:hypothetical protein
MIVTYNWLKEFVDFEMTPEELGHRDHGRPRS